MRMARSCGGRGGLLRALQATLREACPTALTPQLLERLQHTVRSRVLRHFRRHGLLEPHEAEDMLTWDHGGGFSLDGSVRIEATERAHQDNAAAAQMPVQDLPLPLTSAASPPKPEAPAPQPPDTSPSQTSKWAALLERIYEVFPPICPSCQTPLTSIAFLTDPEPITRILAHIGEPTSSPLIHPPRGPPQTELQIGSGPRKTHEVAQDLPPDDLDQTPNFDPTDPEPIPDVDYDQSWSA